MNSFYPKHRRFNGEINSPKSRYKSIGDSLDSIKIRQSCISDNNRPCFGIDSLSIGLESIVEIVPVIILIEDISNGIVGGCFEDITLNCEESIRRGNLIEGGHPLRTS